MKKFKLIAYLFLAGCLIGAATQPLSAQVIIPQGSIVTSATFSIYATYPTGTTGHLVTLHQVTGDWGECSVTFAGLTGKYLPTPVGSFLTAANSWRSVDVTALVQAWVNGAPNYGILLIQTPMTPLQVYWSSEYIGNQALRPKLEINYMYQGLPYYVLIQKSDTEPLAVTDTYFRNDSTYCTSTELATGNLNGVEKYSILRFNFTVPSGEGCTPGYWRNHTGDWPATGYSTTNYFNTVFGVTYFSPTYTLGSAIWANGGGLNRIARHGTAALLSASHPEVNYPYSVAEVIAMVRSGQIDPLVEANELGCFIR